MWSQPELRELAKRFVPVADEVQQLQSGSDVAAQLFQAAAEQGHYGGRSEATRQGIYVVTPSGQLLGSCNSNDPRKVERMLNSAWARWKESAAAADRLDPASVVALRDLTQRTELPDGATALDVFVRDLPRADGASVRAEDWNRDLAWLTPAEVRTLIPARRPGSTPQVVDPGLVKRLASEHLLDRVRGQTTEFPDRSIFRAALTTEVVERSAERVRVVLRGTSATSEKGRWRIRGLGTEQLAEQRRGVALALLGHAVWLPAERRLLEFELVAVGERWGGTAHNRRGDDLGRSPIGFVVRLAGPDGPGAAKR